MNRERERLIPVRDEAELRAGDIVVLRQCLWCGAGSHRTMILGWDTECFMQLPDGSFTPGRPFKVAPALPCRVNAPLPGLHGFVRAIREGRLFKVDLGLDNEQQTTRERTKERVR